MVVGCRRHRNYRGTPLAAVPSPSRFSDPQARYAVLYAAETVCRAFWETLGRNRFARRRRELPRAEAESALIVSIACDGPVRLVDLRGDGPVHIGAPSAVAHDGNHAAGRALRARSTKACPRRTASGSRRGSRAIAAWPSLNGRSAGCGRPASPSLSSMWSSWKPSTTTTSC